MIGTVTDIPHVSFKHGGLIEFFNYWLSLCADGRIPHSRDFLANPNRSIIPWCYIFELPHDSTVRCRFMGTELVRYWQIDFTLRDLDNEFPEPKQLEALRQNYLALNAVPCGMADRVTYTSLTGLKCPQEQLALPLAVDDGKPPRTVMHARPGKSVGTNDRLVHAVDLGTRQWVDIGFGVPDHGPAVAYA